MAVADSEIAPFLALARRLLPQEQEREWMFDWMAHALQSPQEKPNFGVLLAGSERSRDRPGGS